MITKHLRNIFNTSELNRNSVSAKIAHTAAGGGIYCLGFIGAVVYYIGASASFWDGVLGILKSLVWPAFLVHGLLKFLGL